MKIKKILIICMLLGTMLLTSCGKTDHPDQMPNATEQTSEETRQTTDERSETTETTVESVESTESVERTESTEFADHGYQSGGERSDIASHRRRKSG